MCYVIEHVMLCYITYVMLCCRIYVMFCYRTEKNMLCYIR